MMNANTVKTIILGLIVLAWTLPLFSEDDDDQYVGRMLEEALEAFDCEGASNGDPADGVDARLQAAIEGGDLPAVERLLGEGANPNARVFMKGGEGDEWMPLLHLAVIAGELGIAIKLVDAGADRDETSFDGSRVVDFLDPSCDGHVYNLLGLENPEVTRDFHAVANALQALSLDPDGRAELSDDLKVSLTFSWATS